MSLMMYFSALLAGAAGATLASARRGLLTWLAVAQLVLALLLVLLFADLLRIGIDGLAWYLLSLAAIGWGVALAAARARPVMIAATVGAFSAVTALGLELGWLSFDALGRFFGP